MSRPVDREHLRMQVGATRAALEESLRWIEEQQWPNDVMLYIDTGLHSASHVNIGIHCRSMKSVYAVRRMVGTMYKGANNGTVWLDGKVRGAAITIFLPSDVCHIKRVGSEEKPIYEYDCPSSVLGA